MTVKELKTMEVHEVKDFIRERLMYTNNDFCDSRITLLELERCSQSIDTHLLSSLINDLRVGKKVHRRFDMSGDYEQNKDVLACFDDLGLMQPFYNLSFYKGSVIFTWSVTKFHQKQQDELMGLGTVDIIHFIMRKAWGLKQY